MTADRRVQGAIASWAAFVVIFLVLLMVVVPSAPHAPSLFNGGAYAEESESLFDNSSWLNYTLLGVTFGFHLWCAITPFVGIVCGNATEPSKVSFSYSFSDGGPQTNPPWQTWIAPDGHEEVQYRSGGLVRLLVAD